MSAVADKLREARGYIAEGWTRGKFAADASGDRVYTHSPSAVSFCSIGAIHRAFGPAHGGDWGEKWAVYDALTAVIGQEEIEDWNDADERTQAEVLAAFDKAIELAEREQ